MGDLREYFFGPPNHLVGSKGRVYQTSNYSSGYRVAFLIGHASDGKGAKDLYGSREFDIMRSFSKYLVDFGDIWLHDSYAKGYYSMQKNTKRRMNRVDRKYDIVIPLHFNMARSSGPKGMLALYLNNNWKMAALAAAVGEASVNRFGGYSMRSKAVMSKYDNGYWELKNPGVDTILLELYFGSNKWDCDNFRANPENYVFFIRDLIDTYYTLKCLCGE